MILLGIVHRTEHDAQRIITELGLNRETTRAIGFGSAISGNRFAKLAVFDNFRNMTPKQVHDWEGHLRTLLIPGGRIVLLY